jgi:hypothetical protein
VASNVRKGLLGQAETLGASILNDWLANKSVSHKPASAQLQVRKSWAFAMTVLPLPGLIDPPTRRALAHRARPVDAAGDIDALVAELRLAARAAADCSRAKSTERAYSNDWRDFCAFAHLIWPGSASS